MADKKISALTGATTPLAGTEVLPIVQSGATVKVSVANLTAGRAINATSVNKVSITAPATSATLTIAEGKTLTANNSLTFTGTDATTITFPTTSATVARTDATNIFTGDQLFGTNGSTPLNTGAVRITSTGQDILKVYQPSGQYTCYYARIDNTTSYFAYWEYNTTNVGSITTNGTGTTYGTASDYRLKTDIKPMRNALKKILELRPVTYTWKINKTQGQGFIAHELQSIIPECVVGKKDDIDKTGKPKYQNVDTSFLVATLTAAIQELKAELDATKVEIAALKGD